MQRPVVQIVDYESTPRATLNAQAEEIYYVRVQTKTPQVFLRFVLKETLGGKLVESRLCGIRALWLPREGPRKYTTQNPRELVGLLEPIRVHHRVGTQIGLKIEDWPACWFVTFPHPELNRMPVITDNPKLKGARVLK